MQQPEEHGRGDEAAITGAAVLQEESDKKIARLRPDVYSRKKKNMDKLVQNQPIVEDKQQPFNCHTC